MLGLLWLRILPVRSLTVQVDEVRRRRSERLARSDISADGQTRGVGASFEWISGCEPQADASGDDESPIGHTHGKKVLGL